MTSEREPSLPLWLTIPLLLAVVLYGHWGCPAPNEARRVLEAEGYTDIAITGGGHGWSCSDSDGHATGFTATTPAGARIEGAVCCGLAFKACTVRVERVVRPRKDRTGDGRE